MKYFITVLLMALLVISCGSSKKVTRLDEKSVTDLSGKWNDTDARLVAEEMISWGYRPIHGNGLGHAAVSNQKKGWN